MNGDMSELYSALISGQRVLIGLLARSTIGLERILEVVKRGKKNPEAYVSVYNSLDGTKTGAELAKIVGVTRQAISYILITWEEEGDRLQHRLTAKVYEASLITRSEIKSRQGYRRSTGGNLF